MRLRRGGAWYVLGQREFRHDRFGGKAVADPRALRGGAVARVEPGGERQGVVPHLVAQFGDAELRGGAVLVRGTAHGEVAVPACGEPVQQ